MRFGVFLLKKTKKNAGTISSSIFFLHNRIRIEGDSIQICFDSIRTNLNQISN
jgi:hypothetical protein